MRKILLLLLLSTIGFAQEKEITLGVVQDSLKINNTKDTYAVYLPSNYDKEKEWPVIMLFDPSGRGKVAVENFVEAAGKYGYIIAGSNGVENTTYQESLGDARVFYSEVLRRFNIDESKIYLGGFSGGARLAVSVAVIAKKIKGVIACGGSFASVDAYTPKKNSFLYVGIVGDEDFNYREMKNSHSYLTRLKFDPDLLLFSGEHVWPPKEYITKGVRLLTLKSMTRNIIPKDQNRIKEFYAEDLEFNDKLVSKLELLRAYNDLDEMMENYRFYFDDDTMKERQKEIRKNRIYRTQRNNEYEVDEIESNFYVDYLTYLPKDIAAGDLGSLIYWEDELKSINKDFINSSSEAKRKMGKRVLNFLSVLPNELSSSYNETEELDNLLYINIFETLVNPKAYDAYLSVLKYTVKRGDYGVALYYLEKMLDNGFTDTDKLNTQQGITLLRIQPEYNDLLEAYGLEAMY